MKKTVELLQKGFESSCYPTPEFKAFCKVFKKEFTNELKSVNCTDIVFSYGHFYISGFFTYEGQVYYFSLPDVRDFGEWYDEYNCMNQLLYRTAKDYKDFTGGHNRYAVIKTDMIAEMVWYFKNIN